MRLRQTNDITKYCIIANCINEQVQKDLKRINTSTNTTKISAGMRYAQYIRGGR